MLRTFCNGASVGDRVGRDSIYKLLVNGIMLLRIAKVTILIEASVRLMNFGRTSPSCPAESNSAASHNERIVPTSCAKHSVQVRSALALPSTKC